MIAKITSQNNVMEFAEFDEIKETIEYIVFISDNFPFKYDYIKKETIKKIEIEF